MSCLLSQNLMVSTYVKCATKSLCWFIQNMKYNFATIYLTECTALTVGLYWVNKVSLRRHKLLRVYRVIISNPKFVGLVLFPLAIGRLSTVLAIFENNVSHWSTVCAWLVLTPILSKNSLKDLILPSTCSLSECTWAVEITILIPNES